MLSKIEDDRQTNIPEQDLLAERSHTEQTKMINQILKVNAKKQYGSATLKKNKMALIYDHCIHSFLEETKSHIQNEGLFGKTICQRVMLTEYVFENHRRGQLKHISYINTPVHQ